MQQGSIVVIVTDITSKKEPVRKTHGQTLLALFDVLSILLIVLFRMNLS